MSLKRFIQTLLVAVSLLGLGPAVGAEPVQAVLFTSPYCPHCRHLKQDGFPEQFRQKYAGKVELIECDLTEEANNVLFYQTLQTYGVDSAGIPMLVVGKTVLQGYPAQIATESDQAVQKAFNAKEKTAIPNLKSAEKQTETKPSAADGASDAAADQPDSPAPNSPTAPAAAEVQSVQAQQPLDPQPLASPTNAEDSQLQAHETLFSQITLWAIIGAGLADGINPCAFAVIVFFVSFLAAYK